MRKQLRSLSLGYSFSGTNSTGEGTPVRILTLARPQVCLLLYILGGFCKAELHKLSKLQNALPGKTGFNPLFLSGFILVTYLSDLQGF